MTAAQADGALFLGGLVEVNGVLWGSKIGFGR